jgi:DNA-binding PadR family transcriptional regulator
MIKKEPDKSLELPKFEVLKKIQEGYSISEIAKYRKVSRQSVYEVLSSLLDKGLVTRLKRGAYDLTNNGIETLHKFAQLKYNLRQHNINFKIEVLERSKNWEKKRNIITQLPYFNKKIVLKNNEQELFNFGKVQLRTTTKSVIVKIPTIYSKTIEEAIVQSFNCLYDIIPKIENLFKIRLIKDYKSNIKVISQEYASINDSLAKIYKREGNQLLVTDDEGKIWMITDFSFSNNETEFISPEKSPDDTDAIIPMLNDLRKNPTTFSEVKESIKGLLKIQENQLKVQEMHSINIIKHQKVLDEMLITLKLIQEDLKK